MSRALSAAAAGLALCSTAAAQAEPAVPCLERNEVHGLIAYFLPDVLTTVSQNCKAHLAPDSYVRTKLPQVIGELATGKDAAWPAAKAAFLKLSGDKSDKVLGKLPDSALHPLVDAAMAAQMEIPVTPNSCADVNDVTEALSPLSAAELVDLVTSVLGVTARKDSKMPTCPRKSAR